MAPYSTSIAGQRLGPLVGPPTLGATALEALRTSILTGKLALGERLVEASLSRELGISRGPLREALTLLEREGLVESRSRRGRSVIQITSRSLDEHYKLRSLLEVEAVGELIDTLSPRKQRTLEASIKRLSEAARGEDALKLALCDLALHDTFYQLTDNELLVKVWQENIAVKLRLLINITGRTHPRMTTAANHEEIVAAILEQDRARASRLVRAHVDDAWKRARARLGESSLAG